MIGDLGQLVGEWLDDSIILRGKRFRVGLVGHRMQRRAHPRPRNFGSLRHQVGCVMGSAALPRHSAQRRPDRGDQAGVGVAGDQFDPGETAGGQRLPERQLAGVVLGGADFTGVFADGGPWSRACRARAALSANGERCDGRADGAGDVERRGDDEKLIGFICSAVAGQLFHVPHLTEMNAGIDDEQDMYRIHQSAF